MKKIILGVAVSAALFSIEASALSTSVIPVIAASSPSKVDWSTATGVQNVGNVPAANVVYANGSSAATKFLGNAITAVAKPNTIVYKYSNTAADIFTYVFTTGATPPAGFVANQNYIVHKRDRDGSMMAPMSATGLPGTAVVNAVTYNSLVDFATNQATWTCGAVTLDPTKAVVSTCTNTTAEVLVYAPATATGLAGKAGILGIADVDAAQFASPLNGANTANLLTTKAATMGSIPVAAQVFGIAVNLKLRDAMQVAEIASGALPATCASTATPDIHETEACMPSFTSEQISSIFAQGRFNDWTNLSYGTGTNLVSANTATKPDNTAVHICSRAAGSGTLATINTVYENAPCTASNEAIQAATSATVNPVAINTVTTSEGAAGATKAYYSTIGSTDLENCLKTMDSFAGAAPTVGYGNFAAGTGQVPTFTPVAAAGGFRWAVGILNADRNTANALPYRFVKIDGYAPSLANTANGKYRFWSELSVIKATPATALTGGSLGLYNAMIDPAIIVKSKVTHVALFDSGYMGVASTAVPGATAFDPLRPVMPFTHQNLANTAGSVNHCRAATIMSGTKYLPWLN